MSEFPADYDVDRDGHMPHAVVKLNGKPVERVVAYNASEGWVESIPDHEGPDGEVRVLRRHGRVRVVYSGTAPRRDYRMVHNPRLDP